MLKLIRHITATIFFWISGSISLIPLILRPFHPNNAYIATKIICPFILKLLGVKLKTIDAHLLNPETPKVYIANHQDTLDVFVLGCVFPKKALSIGKKAIKWIPVFGWVYWLSGHRLIDRKNHESAIKTLTKVEKDVFNKNLSLWVFPEGTRSKGRGLSKFKKGAFYTAINNKVNIQPIVASTYCKHINLNHWKSGTAHVKILPEIDTSSYTTTTVDELRQYCQDIFQETIDELDQMS